MESSDSTVELSTPDSAISPQPQLISSALLPSKHDVALTADLENLQSSEQRRVLDVVAKVQRCGLTGVLSFPQLVVCGDQSAGKGSVLEALTGVPFPRSENLCTRYATEISLRRAITYSLTIRVRPDGDRPASERDQINAFSESITDLVDLPRVMELAMQDMGIGKELTAIGKSRAFAKDVLSIIIEGPGRPQLALVDIPGLIANDSRGVTKEDVKLVESITDSYINNPRTICLAVVTATNDYANQKILTKVREVDPEGKRTLGIITKPDHLPAGSGSEKSFIELAQNKDIAFELGWHVLKNRKFEETNYSLLERNASEDLFFMASNFKTLPKDNIGIDNLRKRLSKVLFEHIKNELPKLRKDLDTTPDESKKQLHQMGIDRSTPSECKAYLSQLSQEYWAICKDAVNGHYENEYFLQDIDNNFALESSSTIRRTRAVVQTLNSRFARDIELRGHKYSIKDVAVASSVSSDTTAATTPAANTDQPKDVDAQSDDMRPKELNHKEAINWVKAVLVRSRGKELYGNYIPLLIGELFREQATKWNKMATDHVELVHDVCTRFLQQLLADKCIEDVESRLGNAHIEEALEMRRKRAHEELAQLVKKIQSHPINYNHYYTETIAKRRQLKTKSQFARCIATATSTKQYQNRQGEWKEYSTTDEVVAVKLFSEQYEADMEDFSSNEALECLLAIYKVRMPIELVIDRSG